MSPHSPERKRKMSEAAHRAHERKAGDPTQLEIYGCDPCPEYPFGLEGLAKQNRDPNRRGNEGLAPEVDEEE